MKISKGKLKLLIKIIIGIVLCTTLTFVMPISFNKIKAASKQIINISTSNQTYNYNGEKHSFVINGEVTDNFKIEYYVGKTYVETPPHQAGSYDVRVTRPEDDNYYEYRKTIYGGLTITPATYDLTGLKVLDQEVIFDGKEHYPLLNKELPVGLDNSTIKVTYSKKLINVTNGKEEVKVYLKSDSTNYEKIDLTYTKTVEIKPKEIKINWSNDNYTFNNENQFDLVKASYIDVSNVEQELTLSITESEFKNYQENGYLFTASFKSNETNYSLPKNNTKTYNIKRLSYNMSNVLFENQEIIYDGKEHELKITGDLPIGIDNIPVAVNYIYNGNIKDVTNNKITFTARFSGSSNYLPISDKTAWVLIKPKVVELNWTNDDFTFNNTDQSNNVKCWWFDINNQINYCKTDLKDFKNYQEDGYLVTPSFVKSNPNYQLPNEYQKTYHIKRLSYDMSKITFKDQEFIYDGKSHEINIEGVLPTGIDDIKVRVEYNYSSETINVSNESITVTASFIGSTNYEPINSMTAYVLIKPYVVTINWIEDDFTFNNEDQSNKIQAWWWDINNDLHYFDTTKIIFKDYLEDGYLVSCSFKENDLNYALPTNNTKTYNIKRLSYDMSGITFESKEFTYDGNNHYLNIEGILPTSIDNVKVSVKYEYSGSTIVVSGKVNVKAVFTGSSNYLPIDNMENWMIINPKVVEINWCEDKFNYTGLDQSNSVLVWWNDINNTRNYFKTDLKDFINYKEDGYVVNVSFAKIETNYKLPENASKIYHIKKLNYSMSSVSFIDTVYPYDGASHTGEIKGILPIGIDSSTVEVSYSNSCQNVSDGKVLVTVTFKSTSINYNDPEPISAYISIEPKRIEALWCDDDFTYNGENQKNSIHAWWFDIENEKHEAFIQISNDEFIDCSSKVYLVKAVSSDSNYQITINQTKEFHMKKATYDMSNVSFVDTEYEYDGENHSLVISGDLPIGKDGIQVTVDYSKETVCNVIDGKLLVRARFKTTSVNYEIPNEMLAYVSITPRIVKPTFIKNEFSYNGTNLLKEIQAWYYDVNDNKVSLGLQVKSSTNGTTLFRDAGTYILEAIFNSSDSNYKLDNDNSEEYIINKIDYDMTGISLEEQEFVYDGKMHNLTISGKLPIGLDNITLEVVYSEGLTLPGSLLVTASFVTSSINYNVPEPINAYVRVRATALNSDNYSIMVSSTQGFTVGSKVKIVEAKNYTKVPSSKLNRFEKVSNVYELRGYINDREVELSDICKENEITIKVILPSDVLYSKYKIGVIDSDGNFEYLNSSIIPSTTTYHMLNGYFETNITSFKSFVFICEEECYCQSLWIVLLITFITFVIITFFIKKHHELDKVSITGCAIDLLLIIILIFFSHCAICWIMFGINMIFLGMGTTLFVIGKRIQFNVETEQE